MKYRCLKCEKEFDILKQTRCCKGADSIKVADGMTMEELQEAISESNIDIWDWLFEARIEIARLRERQDRLSQSVRVAVKELNKLEYLM